MATYAIGDIQGCFEPLQRLLARISFDAARDRLWLVGDLVNRGPQSLEVLRWAKALGDRATVVLGNHELRLLTMAHGLRQPKWGDTLDEILGAPDRDDLMDWLASRPFVYREGSRLLVHAGLHPAWTTDEAIARGGELHEALKTERRHRTLVTLRDGEPSPTWRDSLRGHKRLCTIAAILTRIRTCTAEGRLCLQFVGPPQRAPKGCLPWFQVPGRRSEGTSIVFGHWAALGFHSAPGVLAMDSGCARGQALTAARLEDGQVFQEPAHAWP